MLSARPWAAPRLRPMRLAVTVLAAALVVAACSSSAATPPPTTPPATPAPTDSPTPQPTATATATDTPTPTPAATAVLAATASSAATTASSKPAATATPLPPLAIGLCTGAQLHLTLTSWQNSSDSYAHVTATNVSSASCNMRGSARAQILDGHGNTIADAGSAAAKVATSDPVYTLAPNGTINTILDWGNWCKSAPAQKVTVAMVLPFGLGRLKAAAIGNAPIPTCYANTQSTTLSSEAWLP